MTQVQVSFYVIVARKIHIKKATVQNEILSCTKDRINYKCSTNLEEDNITI